MADDEKIRRFRETLEKYAEKKGLKITKIPGWTDGKIEWMALNECKCCCDPENRHCPCKLGMEEIKNNVYKDNQCKCSVFERDWKK